jgi:predicted RNase H-like nuclease (RuvC/YqgF family)
MNLKQKKTRITKLNRQITLAKEMYKKEVIGKGTYNKIIEQLQKEITELTG